MNVHFLEPSPYLRRYLDFIRHNGSHFPPEDHRFVIYVRPGTRSVYVPEPTEDLKVINTKRSCIVEISRMHVGDAAIIHGMFNPYLALALLLHPRKIAKSVWSIWGGDLYFYRLLDSLSDYAFEFVRRVLLPRIPYLVTFVAGDIDVARRVYRCRGRHLVAFYPNPLGYDNLPAWKAKGPAEPTVFLVGNSGAPTNAHVDALERLSAFADEEVEVICPLSYGGSEEYVNNVVECGKTLFGTRFHPLREFMQPGDYMSVLERVDIVVMNQDRQQGLGNLLALLAMGKTLYLRGSSTAFEYFSKHGVEVWSVEELSDTPFGSLPVPSEATAMRGRSFVTSSFSEARALSQWRDVFAAVAEDRSTETS